MKKVILYSVVLLAIAVCLAIGAPRTIDRVKEVEGTILHTMQTAWVVVDASLTAGTDPCVLGTAERTKATIDAAILAAANGDDDISTFVIPANWNSIRIRVIGATPDGTCTYEIYLGTLGAGTDCDVVYVGSLACIIGAQASSTTAGYELADAITVTAKSWGSTWGSVSPADDTVAEAELDLKGADFMVVMASASNNNVKLIGKGY